MLNFKTFLFTILITLTVHSFTVGQTQSSETQLFSSEVVEYFTNQLVEEANGVVMDVGIDDDIEYVKIWLGNYHNFDLVRNASRNVISQYRDVRTINSWRMGEGYFYTSLNISGNISMITYFEDYIMVSSLIE